MTTAEERHAAQLAAIKEGHKVIRDRFLDRKETEIEIGTDVRLGQLGLQMAHIDDLGRIWRIDQTTAKLVFDPSWLHPTARWYPDLETMKAHDTEAPAFMGFDMGDSDQWTEENLTEMMNPRSLGYAPIGDLDINRLKTVTQAHFDEKVRPHMSDAAMYGVSFTRVEDGVATHIPLSEIYKSEPAEPASAGENMSDDQKMEEKIVAAGATAPRLTPQHIESKIVGADYYRFPGTTLTVCALTLANGFQVTGESAAASPENYREEIGREIAYNNAKQKIWALEGYVLKQQLMYQAIAEHEVAGNDATDTQAANGNPAHD